MASTSSAAPPQIAQDLTLEVQDYQIRDCGCVTIDIDPTSACGRNLATPRHKMSFLGTRYTKSANHTVKINLIVLFQVAIFFADFDFWDTVVREWDLLDEEDPIPDPYATEDDDDDDASADDPEDPGGVARGNGQRIGLAVQPQPQHPPVTAALEFARWTASHAVFQYLEGRKGYLGLGWDRHLIEAVASQLRSGLDRDELLAALIDMWFII
ncbi:hypothetical protein B0H66DRAFT_638455 [Apodospora peruviana]|uniref:Uncharacterized protein n=1 Tax=Apodospora peruviana TaxID=516989 RepID=A0AAE0IBN0_9PEZI|nr:hypothetical protein B0H66DRAFT_638455 [Apodospora peruviana]